MLSAKFMCYMLCLSFKIYLIFYIYCVHSIIHVSMQKYCLNVLYVLYNYCLKLLLCISNSCITQVNFLYVQGRLFMKVLQGYMN